MDLEGFEDFEARLSAGGGTRRHRNGVLALVFSLYDSSAEPVQTTFVQNVSNSLTMARHLSKNRKITTSDLPTHGPYSRPLYQKTDFEARLSAGGGTRRRRNGVLAVVFTFYDSSAKPVQTTFVENVSNSLTMA